MRSESKRCVPSFIYCGTAIQTCTVIPELSLFVFTSVKAFNKPCVNAKHRSFICRASSALQSMLLL